MRIIADGVMRRDARLRCVATIARADRVAWTLIFGGVALLLAAVVFVPRPTALDDVSVEDPPRALSVRGPALAREENGTTVAAFQCGHGRCSYALRIQGDALDEAKRGRTYLARVAAGGGSALDPPLQGEPANVTRVAPATYAVRPFWPAFAAAPAGALLVVAGAARTRAPQEALRVSGAGAAGAVLGAWTSSFPGDALVFGIALVVLASMLALLAVSVQRWRSARWAVVAFALATIGMFLYARPWFPSAPSV